MNMITNERIFGLDLLRAALMFLGIPYHAGLIFSGNFIYTSSFERVNTIYYLALIPHAFRMQVFFLIAGFFTSLLISKKGIDKFTNSRVNKVIVPFFIFYLLFDTILHFINKQNYLIDWNSALFGHFWFMYTLLAFYAAIFILKEKILQPNIKLIISLSLFFIVMSTFTTNSFIFNILKYMPFFIFGIYVYNQLIDYNLSVRQYVLLSASFITTSVLSFYFYIFKKDLPYYSLIENSLFIFVSFSSCILIFFAFKSLKVKNNWLLDLLVKSSFTVYIVHMPLVILWSIILDSLNVNYFLYFSLIVLMTTLSSMVIFFLLRSNSIASKVLALK